MEPPSRRRRPVTYSKSTRKRLSDISEVFASPRPPPPVRSESPPPQAAQVRSSRVDKQSNKRLNPNKPSRPAPLSSSSGEEDSSGTTGDQKKPPGATNTKPKKPTAAPNLTPQLDTGVYDIPSSADEDEDQPTSPRVQKRKRPISTASKPSITSRVKAPVIQEPIDLADTLVDEMAPTGKRPRAAPRSKTEPAVKRVPAEAKKTMAEAKKITADAKITKVAQKLPEGPQKRQKAEKTERTEKPKPKPAKEAVAPPPPPPQPRSRATRSQSRQLSEPPRTLPQNTSVATARKPALQERAVAAPKVTRKAAEPKKAVGTTKLPAPTEKAEEPILSKAQFKDSLDELLNDDAPVKESSTNKKRNVSSARPKTLQKSKSDIPKTIKMDYDFFGGAEIPAAPPRKRLIDSLGAGPSQPSKRSCTSSSSDDGANSSFSTIFSQQSNSQPHVSQSQPVPMETDDYNSQEVAVLTVPKPMLSNGRVGPKVTYARERSYRVEEETFDEMAILNMPLAVPSYGNRRRLEPTKPIDDEMDIEEPPKKATVKSIHELRAAGEHSRFTDDVEELFGDIDPKRSLAIQRSGYHQIAAKLREKTFLQKFRANGFDERLMSKLELITDEIICFTVSFIALCLLHDDPTPRTMLQLFNNGARPMLVRMLSNPKDINAIAKDRKSNMSKIARESIGELVELVTKSPAFPESGAAALSPQFISLKVLDSLVRKLREHGNHDNILPQGAVNTLVGIMKPFIGIKEYPKTSKINSSALLSLVISILEAYSIGGRIQFRKELSLAELEIVAGLLPILLEWAKNQNLGTNMDLGMDIQLALRFYINISNDFADVCDIIGPSLMPVLIGLVKKSFAVLDGTPEEQERAAYLDLLVLSFGLLLNFAELSAASRESVRTKTTSAENDTTGLDELLTIFTAKLQKTAEAASMEESHTNVVFGYLSVLLGDLCRDDHVRYRVRSQLKGSLKPLLDAIEEFIAYNHKVDGMFEGGAHNNLTARYEEVTFRLRSYG